MFIILDLDDVHDIQVVRHDVLADEEAGLTMHFDEKSEAEDYASRHLGEYLIVELDN
jgi:hypothetical protein